MDDKFCGSFLDFYNDDLKEFKENNESTIVESDYNEMKYIQLMTDMQKYFCQWNQERESVKNEESKNLKDTQIIISIFNDVIDQKESEIQELYETIKSIKFDYMKLKNTAKLEQQDRDSNISNVGDDLNNDCKQECERLKERISILENENIKLLMIEKQNRQSISESNRWLAEINHKLKQKDEKIEFLKQENVKLSYRVEEIHSDLIEARDIHESSRQLDSSIYPSRLSIDTMVMANSLNIDKQLNSQKLSKTNKFQKSKTIKHKSVDGTIHEVNEKEFEINSSSSSYETCSSRQASDVAAATSLKILLPCRDQDVCVNQIESCLLNWYRQTDGDVASKTLNFCQSDCQNNLTSLTNVGCVSFCGQTELPKLNTFCGQTDSTKLTLFDRQTEMAAFNSFCDQTMHQNLLCGQSNDEQTSFCGQTEMTQRNSFCGQTDTAKLSSSSDQTNAQQISFCCQTDTAHLTSFGCQTDIAQKTSFCGQTDKVPLPDEALQVSVSGPMDNAQLVTFYGKTDLESKHFDCGQTDRAQKSSYEDQADMVKQTSFCGQTDEQGYDEILHKELREKDAEIRLLKKEVHNQRLRVLDVKYDMRGTIVYLEGQITQLNETISTFNLKEEENRLTVTEEWKNKEEILRQHLNQANDKCTSLELETGNLKDQIMEQQIQVESLCETITKKEETIKKMQTDHACLQNDYQDAMGMAETIMKNLNDYTKKSKKMIGELEEEIGKEKIETERLVRDVKIWQEKYDDLKKVTIQLESQVDGYRQALEKQSSICKRRSEELMQIGKLKQSNNQNCSPKQMHIEQSYLEIENQKLSIDILKLRNDNERLNKLVGLNKSKDVELTTLHEKIFALEDELRISKLKLKQLNDNLLEQKECNEKKP